MAMYVFFFFFKQKTAYEIGTGDWSSDVCSSDLDDSTGPGTHRTAWHKTVYFDSYGLPPPEEFLDRVGNQMIEYNCLDIQNSYDPPFCGHLCLGFLEAMSSGKDPEKFLVSSFRV